MEVVSISPLPVDSVVWQPRPGAWIFSFACKATFRLLPGQAVLAEEQEPLYREDRHWSDDPAWSLYAPRDVTPVLQRADVVLVGEAFAPAGSPARKLSTRLRVGPIDKRVEVWGDRSMGADGSLIEGGRFARMPLLWERAAGGPETTNPVGVRADAKDAYGRRSLPNLVPPRLALSALDEVIPPVGYGPIAPSWPERQQKLGRFAGAYPERDWMLQPLPPGVDVGYFGAATWDQQVERLRDDERLVLDHMHPDHPHLATQLPGHHPRAFSTRPGRGAEPVPMHLELLWIRADLGLCTATWRGQVRLEREAEEGRIVVALEEPGQTLSWQDIAGGAARPPMKTEDEEAAPITLAPPQGGPPADGQNDATAPAVAPPYRRPPAPTLSTREDAVLPFSPHPAALPFASTAGAAAPVRSEDRAQRLAGTPFSAPAAALPVPVMPPAPPPMPPAPPAPAVFPGGTPSSAPPPAFASAPLPAMQPMRTIGEAAANVASPLRGPDGSAGSAGTLSSSNAAAAATAPWSLPRPDAAPGFAPISAGAAPTAIGGREVLQILWFDPESPPRFRRQEAWRRILEDLEKKPLDKEHEDPALAKEPMEIEDRREVFEILVRGSATDAEGMDEALDGAIRNDGKLVPPLRILAGDLIFPFDEVDALKATIAAVSPFVGQDENLRAAITNAQEFLKADLRSAPTVAEGFRAKVAEAWAQGKRPTPPGYLESTTERALLEGRSYQRRRLFGGPHLRALAQAASSQTLLPAYLPEPLADQLPLYQRFRVRAIVEVHPQVDQHEVQPLALRMLALARVTPVARRER